LHLRPASDRAYGKNRRAATNSQVVRCFRRRMPIENPGRPRRTTDTSLIFCCKEQQKQRERGSRPAAKSRSFASPWCDLALGTSALSVMPRKPAPRACPWPEQGRTTSSLLPWSPAFAGATRNGGREPFVWFVQLGNRL